MPLRLLYLHNPTILSTFIIQHHPFICNILEQKCQLFPIETYIKRRRGTLWKYLLEYRKGLVEETAAATTPAKNPNKILWWRQPYIKKKEMAELKNFWLN